MSGGTIAKIFASIQIRTCTPPIGWRSETDEESMCDHTAPR